MISIAVVDTGPLVAAANSADPDFDSCLKVFQSADYFFVIPALCVAEAAYLVGSRKGAVAEARFLRGLEIFDVESPRSNEWGRIAELVEEYASLRLGATDASVMSLAERLETETVVTLDHRHFGVVQPRHCQRFRLLPEK